MPHIGLHHACRCDTSCIHTLFAPGRSILENRGVIPASELTNNHTTLHTWACCGGRRLQSSRLRGDKDGKRFAGGELVAGYLFIGETSFWYCDYLCLQISVYYENGRRVLTLCKHLCTLHFTKVWKFSIVAQQITWHHDRNSNKSQSQLATQRYSFPFRRKECRNY